MFVTELVKSGKYRVIEREQLAAIMQEKNLSLSGEIDPKTAVKAGKLLGVEYIITGALTELGVADRGRARPVALRDPVRPRRRRRRWTPPSTPG